jgi:uncharacterized protein (TIGR03086 family)
MMQLIGGKMTQQPSAITNHRRACNGFSAIVAQGEGRWTNASPCPEWDARGVVEHVIGFHDALLLGPTATAPERPMDDPIARWALTVAAMDSAMDAASSKDLEIDLDHLLPALTGEVLTHTWDLAKAIGVDPQLDAELSAVSYGIALANDEQVRASGLFDSAVPVPGDAAAATQLVAFFGRDPEWTV